MLQYLDGDSLHFETVLLTAEALFKAIIGSVLYTGMSCFASTGLLAQCHGTGADGNDTDRSLSKSQAVWR
jgi:hypothetical protein